MAPSFSPMSEGALFVNMQAIFFNHKPEEHFIGHQFAEIYKDRIYHPYFRGRKNLTVFDMGAHIGVFSLYAYKYAKVIHAFEPAKEHFDCLESMKKFNSMDNLYPHNQAIALESGEQELFHTGNVTSYSLNSGFKSDLGSEKIQAITIKQALEENKVEVVDFLKLDIEGEEAKVLGGKDFREVCPRIKEMVVELHKWAIKSPMQTINALTDLGYEVRPIINQDADLYHAKRT